MLPKPSSITMLALLFVLSFVAAPISTTPIAYSQAEPAIETEVKCGDIVEDEFINNAEEHIYLLPMQPRESFEVTLEPAGDDLKTLLILYGPTGIRIEISGEYIGNTVVSGRNLVSQAPKLVSGTLSSTGMYIIRVANTAVLVRGHQDIANDQLVTDNKYLGGVGVYWLSIGCTLADGSRIEPGAVPQPTPTPAPLPTPTPRSALPDTSSTFTGTGFPGLAPVDFADAVTVPLLLDKEMIGVIPLDNQILGFTLDAAAGDTLDLSYTRVSGNMNLGLVVLSENNEVFFQASLVTSTSLATQFTLPAAGQYTIGVFRISLVEPEEVEPTVFQVKGTLAE